MPASPARAGLRPARRLIVVGPVPPPVHGVAVSTELVLRNPLLRERFAVEHLDTTDRRPLSTMGAWDVTNVRQGLRDLVRLTRRLGGPRGIVYLPLSQSTGGFARDALFVLAAKARGWRVAVHLRGGEFDAFLLRLPVPLRAAARWVTRRIDAVAVMGERLKEMFRGLVAEERIAAVPNGTPDEFPDVAPGGRDRSVLYLSNFRERKGLIPALEAARITLARVPDARFVFAGAWRSGDLRRELEARYGPVNGIEFVPPPSPEERRALLAKASVFLFPPTEPEGHPRVVLEALAAGLPVVTTARGAIPETVEDGVSGFVLSEADPNRLADAVTGLLGDEARRVEMATAARRRYVERFTQEAADRALADWLEAVAA